MIRILRLAGSSDLLTAEVFEALFRRQLGSCFDVRPAPLPGWVDGMLGDAASPAGDAAALFAERTRGVDFLSPSYEATPLAPLLLALRNRSGARVRLLLIAHAPGAYLMEWVLLAPLLAPGDRIVAPSENARDVIALLDPALAPFVRVIPHPMAPLPAAAGAAGERIVSLGRIHPAKLVHRQIEAMHLLRGRGRALPRLEIAGDPCDAGSGEPHPYARSLREKIRRLGLEDVVRLAGPIRGEQRKAAFLAGSRMLLNLSVTVEESFGKAPVEALGVGVPVLATRWNGLPETVGDAGALVPVEIPQPGAADASAESVAEGISRLLDSPPGAERCRAQAERFRPEAVLPRYAEALEEALGAAAGTAPPGWPGPELDAAPQAGLLATLAPLTAYGWDELFERYRRSCHGIRRAWAGLPPGEPTEADRVRSLLLVAARAPLELFLSGGSPAPSPGGRVPAGARPADYAERLAAAAALPGRPTGRIASLMEVRNAGRTDRLRQGVLRATLDGVTGAGMDYLRAELRAADGDLAGALELCGEAIGPRGAGELEAHRLRHLAQLARRAGRPAEALPPLAAWLDRFPDSPDAGPVWLDLAVNALQAGRPHLAAAPAALSRARALLGDIPALRKARGMVAALA